MTKRYLATILLVLSFGVMFAWTATYSVKTLGIQVAGIEINTTANSLEVWARTDASSSLAPAMDNYYRVDFDSSYLPQSFLRIVRQETDSDTVHTSYDHTRLRAVQKRYRTSEELSFDLEPDARDIFSVLALVSGTSLQSNRSFVIDANSKLWDLNLSLDGNENLRTRLGRLNCQRYSLQIVPRGPAKAPYVDMVTNNMLNPDTQIQLWIGDNGLIAKALVRRGLSVLNWELNSFQP